jgi:hypothetical protein
MLSMEPSSDVFLDSDIQSSVWEQIPPSCPWPSRVSPDMLKCPAVFTGSRESYDITSRRPPVTLRRVGPHRRKNCLYESGLEREFLGWWEKTEYGQKLNGDGQSQIKWSTESPHADVWKHFDQVAGIDSGRPRVFCQARLTLLDHPQYKKNGTSAISRHQKSNPCRKGKERESHQALISDWLQNHSLGVSLSNNSLAWGVTVEEYHLSSVAISNCGEPCIPETTQPITLWTGDTGTSLSKNLRRRLRNAVTAKQESQLQDLPEDAKVSFALDCWTSPFQQAFMAITVYLIDKDWNYREMLLDFEPLHGSHNGINLSDVLH